MIKYIINHSVTLLIALTCGTVATAQQKQRTLEDFKKYDITENGYLSGTEITSCDCKHFDANGDGIITDVEYRNGLKTGAAARKEKSSAVNTNSVRSSANGTVIGKRVEVNDRAYWYKATILEQKGHLYKVRFDGYTSADDKWVTRAYMRDLDINENAVSVTCSFNAPAGNFTNSSPASDDLFKREVYDWYSRTVNGTLSRPTRIGVVFTHFERKQPYKNTVTNVPGRGATRRHEGAPANTTIYPVKMTYHVCEDYNGTISQKQVNTEFSFFINKDGEWTCSKDQ